MFSLTLGLFSSRYLISFPIHSFSVVNWTTVVTFSIYSTGSYLNVIKRTVKYLCPADIVPPYIDVDLSELDVGQKLVMRDLKVHPRLQLLQSPDQPVCKIAGSGAQEKKKSK